MRQHLQVQYDAHGLGPVPEPAGGVSNVGPEHVALSMQPGLFSLLPQVVDAVRLPVVAAGGMADGRTAAAAFMLGASAVQLDTAFLLCEEADVRDAHRAALAEAGDACTVVTDVISGRPCRYIRNKLIDDLESSGLAPLPVPAQQSLTQRLGDSGDRDWTALTSGQSAALARVTKAPSWSSGSPTRQHGAFA